MNRKTLQDVVPQRSIRDIPVPGKRMHSVKKDPVSHERELLLSKIAQRSQQKKEPVEDFNDFNDFDDIFDDSSAQKNFTKWGFWVIVVAGVLFFIFSIILFFAGGVVTITPKQNTVTINTALVARSDIATTTALTYQVLTLAKEVTATIPAGSSTVSTVNQAANGKITIFNSFSATPVVLIKNTRFESPEGLIYRIQEPIRVPGYTTQSGSIVPGKLEVTVVADEAGSKYNIGPAKFKIPGFATDQARYQKITAESTVAMTGGIAKGEPSVSLGAEDPIVSQLQKQLKDELLKEAQSQKAVDTVLYEQGYHVVYAPLTQTKNTDATLTITQKGTIYAVVFNKKSLSKAVLGDEIEAIGGEVEVRGIENLTFIPDQEKNIWEQNPLRFKVEGTINIVGVVASEEIKQALAGTTKADLQKIINNYPTIEKASATIRPFWKDVFPTDTAKIKVTIVEL